MANDEVITKDLTETAEPVIDQALVDKLQKEMDVMETELKEKVYPLSVEDEDGLQQFISFIDHEANWANMEALGVIEVSKSLTSQVGKVKNGNVYLKNLEIDALNYFLGKVKGTGIDNAVRHLKLVKPVNEVIKIVKIDIDKINAMQRQLAAAENGIQLDTGKNQEEKGAQS